VRLGLRTLDAAEILDGLSAGELVLMGTAPQPGQRVRVEIRDAASARAGNGKKEDAGAAMTGAMGR
jgi:HlyD family secretion protein